MSATDELRRMLDERGLTYEEPEDCTTIYYDKDGSRYTYNVDPKSGWAQLFGYHITPEKAIAATLGAKTTTRDGKHRTRYGRIVPLCECCGYAIGDERYNYCPKCGAKII